MHVWMYAYNVAHTHTHTRVSMTCYYTVVLQSKGVCLHHQSPFCNETRASCKNLSRAYVCFNCEVDDFFMQQ